EVALKLELHDDKDKQKFVRILFGLSGVDTIGLDSEEKKLKATRDMDHEYSPPIPTNYARVVAIKPTNNCVIF
ncbi:unnamed protein product, partial [Ilex paraguariensis]